MLGSIVGGSKEIARKRERETANINREMKKETEMRTFLVGGSSRKGEKQKERDRDREKDRFVFLIYECMMKRRHKT